ncbi:hypothetical protein KR018_005008, partial [Drosophila ironensis]
LFDRLVAMPPLSRAASRIVIVGAGASGVAAATRLLENGFSNVQILEAESYVGGRVHTIPFADNVVDLGAQWCHGMAGNCVYELVKNLDIVTPTGKYFDDIVLLRSNKDVLPKKLEKQIKKIALQSLPGESSHAKGSMGSHVVENFWKAIDSHKPEIDRNVAFEALESFLKHQSSIEGSDNLFEVSGQTPNEYDECDGDQHVHWRSGGFVQILRVLMKVAPDKPNELGVLDGCIKFNKTVNQIQIVPNRQLLVMCDDECIKADHVICTVSLGVLKDKCATMFVPPLPPPKLTAIHSLQLGTVDKVYFEFDEPPFPKDFIGFYPLWLKADVKKLRKSEFAWLEGITRMHVVTCQPRILMGFIVGEHARKAACLSDEKILEGMEWLFRKFLKFSWPHPKRFLRTQWYLNPNFRGSYSYRPTTADEKGVGPWDLRAPIMVGDSYPILMFAGEASSRYHHSTVHGAVESGWREAQRLIEFY